MAEIKLSKDYPSIFRAAYANQNIDEMMNVFQSFLAELGVPDPGSDAVAREIGRRIAQEMNAQRTGLLGKKI